jgi:O-antigen/teichoic acid export membrane protein
MIESGITAGITERIRQLVHDPFLLSSIYIMLSSVAGAVIGVGFWIVAARIYSQEQVGLGTALISSLTLLLTLSKLGMDQSLIRYFPSGNKGSILLTSTVVSTAVAMLLGVIFLIGTPIWAPALRPAAFEEAALFLMVLGISAVASMTSTSLVASRKASLNLLQTILTGLKVPALFIMVPLGALGIYASFGVGYTVTLLVTLAVLGPLLGVRKGHFDRQFFKESSGYSLGIYASGFLLTVPTLLLPLLVLNTLGPVDSANYYMAYAIVSMVLMIPMATSLSLFVEGSHGEHMVRTMRKSLISNFLLLVPATAGLWLLGDWGLSIIGKEYATGGLELLRIMVLSSFFYAIAQTYISRHMVSKNIQELLLVGAILCTSLLGLSYSFMKWWGLAGVGWAWVLAYGIISAFILFRDRAMIRSLVSLKEINS